MITQRQRRRIGKIVNDCFNDDSGKIVKGVIVDVVLRDRDSVLGGYLVVYKIMPLRPATKEYAHVFDINFGMTIDDFIIGGPVKKDKMLAKKAMAAYKMLKVLDR